MNSCQFVAQKGQTCLSSRVSFHTAGQKNVRQSINNNNHYIKISFHPIYHLTTSKNLSGGHIIFKGKGKTIFVNNGF
jgi:hypothetical protein